MTVEAQSESGPTFRPLPDADILSFLYLEARLADEGRYSEWEALWADDDETVLYRVPMHPDDDPRTTLAYINDNRSGPTEYRQPPLADTAVGDAPDHLQQ